MPDAEASEVEMEVYTLERIATELLEGLRASGTSEGAEKGWDTRGRGRKDPNGKTFIWVYHPALGAKVAEPSDKMKWHNQLLEKLGGSWAKAYHDIDLKLERGIATGRSGVIHSRSFDSEFTPNDVAQEFKKDYPDVEIHDNKHLGDGGGMFDAAAEPTYPADHIAGMRVPKGGSSCASCKYLANNKTDCTSEHFQKWHGSEVIPGKIDEYCSDWYEPREEIAAVGTSEGAEKGWDTRGRGKHEAEIDVNHKVASFFSPMVQEMRDRQVRAVLDYLHGTEPIVEHSDGKYRVVIMPDSSEIAFKEGDTHPVPGGKWMDFHDDDIAQQGYTKKQYTALPEKERARIAAKIQVEKYVPSQYEQNRFEFYSPKEAEEKWLPKAVDAAVEEILAQALFNGIQIEGFTKPEEEFIRAAMSRVPPELTVGVTKVIADRGMGAKHGNYSLKTKEIRINPANLRSRVRLGRGHGWILHAETTMVHEIGHSVFEGLTDEQRTEWLAISGWHKSADDRDATCAERYIERRPGWPPYRSKWLHKKGVGFTRHYAEKNPDEDFADSFSFFILGKPFQMSPKKRRFLEALVQEKVKRYPQALITGPTKPYVGASGTSEGAEKGWDTRGRGKKSDFDYIDKLKEGSGFWIQPNGKIAYVTPGGMTHEMLAHVLGFKGRDDLIEQGGVRGMVQGTHDLAMELVRNPDAVAKALHVLDYFLDNEVFVEVAYPKGAGKVGLYIRGKGSEVAEKLDGMQLHATGTSEGAEKGWDTRGRGRKEELTLAPEAPPKDKPVVLVFGGSFNPPHMGHVGAAKDAAELMSGAGYNVAKVIVTPTADKLLQVKLGEKMYPLAERAELSRKTFPSEMEIASGPAEEAENWQGKLRRTQLADWVRQRYPDHTVVALTGEDAAPGHPPGFPSLYAGDKGSNHEGYYYLAIARLGGLSSSKIRTAIHEGRQPEGMTPEAYEYLKTMLQKHPEIKADIDAAIEELLLDTLIGNVLEELQAGGPGSGCNPAVAVPGCGRPRATGQPTKEKSYRPGKKVAGYFRKNTAIAKMYETLLAKEGQWHPISEFTGGTKEYINARIKELMYTGKKSGKWKVERMGGLVRLTLTKPDEQMRLPGFPAKQPAKDSSEEQRLKDSPIQDSKPLGGGMNRTILVKFIDGSKGVFKPDVEDKEYVVRRNVTPGLDTEREAAAYQVAKLVGLEDMVAPSVIREYNGERGVLLGWQEGKVADAVAGDKKYDGDDDLARAAVFDWVIGNEDRHSGNWVLGDDKKLKLIDHGLSFPDKGPYRGSNDYILSHARSTFSYDTPSPELVAPYVSAQDKIAEVLTKLEIPEGAVKGIKQRIDILQRAKSWRDLREGAVW